MNNFLPQNNLFFELKKFSRESLKTLKLGFPLIISQLLLTMIEFVDSVMAGNLSSTDLAGFAIASAVYHPVFLLVLGILIPISSIIAQLFGSDKPEEIVNNLIQALWLSQFLAFLSILFLTNVESILYRIGYEKEVSIIVTAYLNALCWGIPPVYAFFAFRMFIEGLSITRPAMNLLIIGLGIKIVLNYIFMFGNLNSPALGIVGAGWATSIVHWVIFISMLVFFLRSKVFLKYRKYFLFSKPAWTHLKEILKIGIPHGLGVIAETGLFTMVSLFIGTFGVTSIAGHQIALNVASVTFMVPMGLSIAISIRVGQAIGKSDFRKMSYVGHSGILLCTLFMALVAGVFVVIPEIIAGLYTDDLKVKSLAVNLLYLAAVFQISDGIQVSALGALRGLKDTRIPFLTNVFAYWFIGFPLAYLIGIQNKVGPEGMWVGLITGLSVAAFLHTFRFRIISKRFINIKIIKRSIKH